MAEKASDYGVCLSEEHLRLFELYLNELIEWNSRMNLTGMKERGRMILELFLDSLAAVPHLHSSGSMLDVGSGAGFPAIVIKVLLPGLRLQLVESNSKKANFIKQVIRLLRLSDVEVINKRIEEFRNESFHDGFNVITSRALTNLKQLVNWCSGLLSSKGMLVYYSGSMVDENLKDTEIFLKDQQLFLDRVIPYHLPGLKAQRNIVVLRRNSTLK
jgi:16S rRNA (guanine527-N7)-methyltransferase